MTPNEVLQRLRTLGACGDAVRPEPVGHNDTGWVVIAFEENPTLTLEELSRLAVRDHPTHAWWLAGRFGVARPALDKALRRALVYASEAAEVAGLDGSRLRQVASADVLDYAAAKEAARRAVWAAAKAAGSDARAAWAAALAAVWAVNAANAAARAAWAAEDAARAANAAGGASAEKAKQREDLLALWPEVERAFRAVDTSTPNRKEEKA